MLVALLILGIAPRIAYNSVQAAQEYPGYTEDIPDTEVPEALPSTEARKKPDTEIPDALPSISVPITTDTEVPEELPLTKTPIADESSGRAQVLVIVSDHGSGTTEFGQALNEHPCVFDLGEPFAYTSTPLREGVVWSTLSVPVPGCNMSSFAKAIFDSDTGTLIRNSNPVLTEKILALSAQGAKHGTKKPGFQPVGLTGDSPSLYEGLEYDFAEYFSRVRDLVCAGVPENICPPSDCTITLKLFPQFVNGNTAGQLLSAKPPTKCMNDRNAKTMLSWNAALESIKQHPKVAALTLTRDEESRQFSVFHRFAPVNTQFECSVPRPSYEFATGSTHYTDVQVAIEDCWKGAEGAATCLSDALQLVGLSTEPMGDRGTALMAHSDLETTWTDANGVKHDTDSTHVAASASCTTDPEAIFKRLANNDVERVDAMDEHARLERERFAAMPDELSDWGIGFWETLDEDNVDRHAVTGLGVTEMDAIDHDAIDHVFDELDSDDAGQMKLLDLQLVDLHAELEEQQRHMASVASATKLMEKRREASEKRRIAYAEKRRIAQGIIAEFMAAKKAA